ncbi:MAG: class I mannose-6-phosphate isomerase [Candidatus Cryptobacteroides sp.]
MEENALYPMRICPLEDSYSWGKEEFKIADLGYRDTLLKDGWLAANSLSEVMDTYMDRIVGDAVFSVYGRQFPVQVKSISCEGRMPLRAHPDDKNAEYRYDALGKEKFWYILQAEEDAQLILGFKKDINASSLLKGIENSEIEKDFNYVKVKAGDSYRIKPGLVHGACGKLKILEISESSALDFCIYSWGEIVSEEEFDSALNVVEALDFIDYKATEAELCSPKSLNEHVSELLNIDQFVVNKIDLKESIKISSEKSDTFALYYCLYGKAGIMGQELKQGHLILLPAELNEVIIEPLEQSTALIEVLGQTENKSEEEDEQK